MLSLLCILLRWSQVSISLGKYNGRSRVLSNDLRCLPHIKNRINIMRLLSGKSVKNLQSIVFINRHKKIEILNNIFR